MNNYIEKLSAYYNLNSFHRKQERCLFISDYVTKLDRLTTLDYESQIKKCFKYSKNGVLTAIHYNKTISPKLKNKLITHLFNNAYLYEIENLTIDYESKDKNGLVAYYSDISPKAAIIFIGEKNNFKTTSFIDKDDLEQISIKLALDDMLTKYKNNEISSKKFCDNVLKLSKSKDEATIFLFKVSDNEPQEFKKLLEDNIIIESQLDKFLNNNKYKEIQVAFIKILNEENKLKEYIKKKTQEYSDLDEDAQIRLGQIVNEELELKINFLTSDINAT